jgi:hypothetical protein
MYDNNYNNNSGCNSIDNYFTYNLDSFTNVVSLRDVERPVPVFTDDLFSPCMYFQIHAELYYECLISVFQIILLAQFLRFLLSFVKK